MPDSEWVKTCTSQVAKDSMELLEEVQHELDLLKTKLIINPYPRYVYKYSYDYEQSDRYLQERMDVANMLVGRGVLRSAKPTVRDGDDVIVVTAEREPVVLVLKLLTKRIYGTPGGDDADGNADRKDEQPSRGSDQSARMPHRFLGAFVEAMGTTSGKVIGTLLALGLIGLALRIVGAFR